jgi:hypothetical protein
MDLSVILTIVSLVLAALSGLLGQKFVKVKNKFKAIALLAKETADLIDKASIALEDNVISTEEVQMLQKELADVKAAWKALFEKEVE